MYLKQQIYIKQQDQKINCEAVKLLGKQNIDILVKLFNRIYNIGCISNEQLRPSSTMMSKIANSTKYKEPRLIGTICHMLKVGYCFHVAPEIRRIEW